MENTRVLVIGATGGIGRALARRLAKDGARVAVAARTAADVAALADEIGGIGLPHDATDLQAVREAVDGARRSLGGLDGVVNLVGSLLLKPAHLTSPDEWATTLAQNLTTAFATVRAATAALRDAGGTIVLTSSAAATLGLANHEAIAAAKAGVEGLVRSAAATYGARGIRVNAVAPGMVATPLTERLTSNQAQRSASEALHVLGRIGEPDDVAAAYAFLLDPRNAWITGQVVGVDGGLARVRTR